MLLRPSWMGVVADGRHEPRARFGGRAGTSTVVGAEPERESARAIQDSSAQVKRWHWRKIFCHRTAASSCPVTVDLPFRHWILPDQRLWPLNIALPAVIDGLSAGETPHGQDLAAELTPDQARRPCRAGRWKQGTRHPRFLSPGQGVGAEDGFLSPDSSVAAARPIDAIVSCPAEGCEERPAVPGVRQVGLDVGAGWCPDLDCDFGGSAPRQRCAVSEDVSSRDSPGGRRGAYRPRTG